MTDQSLGLAGGTAIAAATIGQQVVKSGVTYVARVGVNKVISRTVDRAKNIANERLDNISSSCNSIQNNNNLHSLDALSRAGRALDKHGGRPGSVFPKATGNPTSKNMQGQFHLDEILTHPQSITIRDNDRRFEIYAPNGRGVYFQSDGSFRGFVENHLR